MAAHFEVRGFIKSLSWYKRWFFPLFLNDKEMERLTELCSEYTELDEARDYAFFLYNEYCKEPTYDNKERLEDQYSLIRYLRMKEAEKNKDE